MTWADPGQNSEQKVHEEIKIRHLYNHKPCGNQHNARTLTIYFRYITAGKF